WTVKEMNKTKVKAKAKLCRNLLPSGTAKSPLLEEWATPGFLRLTCALVSCRRFYNIYSSESSLFLSQH
ncbi:MAG: hypothetical protein ACPLRU_03780, partial [Desulfofundulus sp.]